MRRGERRSRLPTVHNGLPTLRIKSGQLQASVNCVFAPGHGDVLGPPRLACAGGGDAARADKAHLPTEAEGCQMIAAGIERTLTVGELDAEAVVGHQQVRRLQKEEVSPSLLSTAAP